MWKFSFNSFWVEKLPVHSLTYLSSAPICTEKENFTGESSQIFPTWGDDLTQADDF